MKRFGLFWAALCLVAAVATACGGSGTSHRGTGTETATATASPTGTAATASPRHRGGHERAAGSSGAATIIDQNMSFGEPLTVPPGAQITIKNDDSAEHSVTSDTAGKFDVHVDGNAAGHADRTDRTRRIRVLLHVSPLDARDADRQVVARSEPLPRRLARHPQCRADARP